jgi:hypothetical protein
MPLLPDELVHSRLSNFPRAIGAGIGAMIVAGGGAIQPEPEANGHPAFGWAQDHLKVVVCFSVGF